MDEQMKRLFTKYAEYNQLMNANIMSAMDSLGYDTLVKKSVQFFSQYFCDDELHYQNISDKKFAKNFGWLIVHFFNHQTHHRGQVSTLLNQNNVDIGMTDFLQVI